METNYERVWKAFPDELQERLMGDPEAYLGSEDLAGIRAITSDTMATYIVFDPDGARHEGWQLIGPFMAWINALAIRELETTLQRTTDKGARDAVEYELELREGRPYN